MLYITNTIKSKYAKIGSILTYVVYLNTTPHIIYFYKYDYYYNKRYQLYSCGNMNTHFHKVDLINI